MATDKPMISAKDVFTQILQDRYPNLPQDSLTAILELPFDLRANQIASGSSGNSQHHWSVLLPDSPKATACMRNVLTIGSDQSRWYPNRWKNCYAFDQALDELINYYTYCSAITRLGVFLTDCWRPSTLWKFAGAIESYELMGINSVAILTSNKKYPTPIAWPWR
jgi:hypothetical protein